MTDQPTPSEIARMLTEARIRREVAEEIAQAISGSICGPTESCAYSNCTDCVRYMQAQTDAIIARQIGAHRAGETGDDFGEVSDDHGNAWPRCSADCDLHVVRPGWVQCRCEAKEMPL